MRVHVAEQGTLTSEQRVQHVTGEHTGMADLTCNRAAAAAQAENRSSSRGSETLVRSLASSPRPSFPAILSAEVAQHAVNTSGATSVAMCTRGLRSSLVSCEVLFVWTSGWCEQLLAECGVTWGRGQAGAQEGAIAQTE